MTMTDSTDERAPDDSFSGRAAVPGQDRPPRSIRRLVIAAIAILILLFVVRVGLTFLGGQVQSILAGTVEFGTGGSGCAVEGRVAVFPRHGTMHVVGNLRREVKANEVIRGTITDAAGTSETIETKVVETANCVSIYIPLDRVPSGRYVFEFFVGSESLAKGETVISP
jgi:hypothetical protein